MQIYASESQADNSLKYPDNWFAKWFNEWYLIVYQHRNEKEAVGFTARWPIWERLESNKSHRIVNWIPAFTGSTGMIEPTEWCLDLGCGTGRYAHEFARRGFQTLAVDLSHYLLQTARTYTKETSNLHLVRADMRTLPIKKPLTFIASLFTSFGYFETDNEHQILLKNLADLLKPKGFLILDLPNKHAVELHVASDPITDKTINGISIREERRIENQTNRVVKRIIINHGNEPLEYKESVRLFTSQEIESMLYSAGIKSYVPPWGNYKGDPLKDESPRMIYFGEKLG